MSAEEHSKFMQELEQVGQGIKYSKDWDKVAKYLKGVVLKTLSQGPWSAATMLP
jgi:hypothetical protein